LLELLKLLKFIGVSDENYFQMDSSNADETKDGSFARFIGSDDSLRIRGREIKVKDIARPFIYFTTHFTTLTKVAEKNNDAIK
jgi:hypothetical protein